MRFREDLRPSGFARIATDDCGAEDATLRQKMTVHPLRAVLLADDCWTAVP